MVTAMKLCTLSGAMSDFDAVLAQVAAQDFQPEPAMPLLRGVCGLAAFPHQNPYTALLRRSVELLARLGIPPVPPPAAQAPPDPAAYLTHLQTQLDALLARQSECAHQLENLAHLAEQLDKLTGITARLEDLRSMRFARFRFGWLPRESYDSAAALLDARDDLIFLPTKTDGHRTFGIYFATLKHCDRVDSLFHTLHFVRLLLDEQAEGSAEEMLARLETQKTEAQRTLADLTEALAHLRQVEAPTLCALSAMLQEQNDTYDLRRFAAHAHDSFYLIGWLPAPSAADFCQSLAALPQVSLLIDEAAEVQAHLTPPTKLTNPMLARSFEPFVAMFGLPKYGELDPSLFMALTYILFFGAMFGDLGQGLCLALAGILLHRVKHLWLGPIIACCGLSAAVFGCIYGSVFGFEHLLPGFKVMEQGNILRILQITLFAGVAALALAMLLNIRGSLKRGDLHRGAFGANGIAGLVFYLSLAALVTNWFLRLGLPLQTPLFLLPCVALPLACIFFAEPLACAIEGKPLFPTGIGGFLVVAIFELFETALSYLTNTLSFLRIGAYAIIHVGMMQVVFLLAGESPNPLVLVLGNLFVIGFEGILVGIQVLRLEFYELFGRFYTAGGRPYTGHPKGGNQHA